MKFNRTKNIFMSLGSVGRLAYLALAFFLLYDRKILTLHYFTQI